MATWTNIDDTFLEPGKPARSVDGLALRDNPVAIAEGASGAPRIANNAFSDETLGAEKFQTPAATERDWVLSSTALANTGSVGTYALLAGPVNGGFSSGSTYAGSSLNYSGFIVVAVGSSVGEGGTGASVSGTWKAMGNVQAKTDNYPVTLLLRIA